MTSRSHLQPSYFSAIAITALALPTVVLALAALQTVTPPENLTRDPLAVAATQEFCCAPYLGAISNLGVMLFSGASAVCLFVALLLAGRRDARADIVFFCVAAVMTAFLAADDVLMLHETFGFRVFGLFGFFNAAYLLFLAALVATAHRSSVVRLDMLFAGAMVAFVASLLIDRLAPQWGSVIFVEDGLKLFGISMWTGFLFSQSLDACRARA